MKLRRKKPEACHVPAYMGNHACGGRLKYSLRICSPGRILLSPMIDPMLLQSHMTKILSCLCKLEMRCWHMQDPDAQQKAGLPNSIKMFWAVPQVLIRRSVKKKRGNFLCMCATCVLMTYSAKSNTTRTVSNTLAFAEWPFLSFEWRYPAKLSLF